MIKQFKLEISSPCHEDLNKMQTNLQGFYCNSCAKNVIDLSKKTDYEIGKFVSELKDTTNICARLKSTQLEQDFSFQTIETKSSFKYAAAIAASVLLTTSVVGQEKPVVNTEQTETHPQRFRVGKIARTPIIKQEIITFTMKGKLLDATTNKPFSEKLYPNITVYIGGQSKQAKVNPKTGEFEIEVMTDKSRKVIEMNFSSNDNYFSKIIAFDIKLIKKKILKTKISIKPNEIQNTNIQGGMGIIFYDKKQNIG